jgi:hypothetical protein
MLVLSNRLPERKNSMLRRLFRWEHATAVAVILYLVGGGIWLVGSQVERPKPFFGVAGAVLVIAYVWTLGTIWMHSVFRRSTIAHRSRRYSDKVGAEHSDTQAHEYAQANPERRKRRLRSSKRMERWLVVCASAVVFSAIAAEFFLSYRDQLSKSQQAHLQVFLMDTGKSRTRALSRPVSNQSRAYKEMMFAMVGIPTRNVTIRDSDRSMIANVVIRNSGEFEIENAHIMISSNVPIKAASPQVVQVAETELRTEVDDLPAFRRTGTDTVIPVEIAVSQSNVRAGLSVTILGDGVNPYAAAVNVVIVKKPDAALPVVAEEPSSR